MNINILRSNYTYREEIILKVTYFLYIYQTKLSN